MARTNRQEQDTRPNRALLEKRSKTVRLSRSDLIRLVAEQEEDLLKDLENRG